MQWRIETADDGERLDRVLASRIPAVSRMRLRQLLEEGQVRVDGEPRAAGWRVSAGQAITIDADLDLATAMTPEEIPLEILHEEADLIVVTKPAGMVVHPAGRHRGGTLVNALAYHFNVAGGADPPIRPGLAHRLDRSTSGLMVVAKSQAALSRLTVQFQQKQVEKQYLALVHGQPGPDSGEWSAPIGAAAAATPRWGVRPDGRPALTRWTVLQRLTEHALLALEPVTGRTNQLRIHCAHFGFPIAGDELFGRGPGDPPGRLFLHNAVLGFRHPNTGEPLRFEAPLPPELANYLAACSRPAAPDPGLPL